MILLNEYILTNLSDEYFAFRNKAIKMETFSFSFSHHFNTKFILPELKCFDHKLSHFFVCFNVSFQRQYNTVLDYNGK